MEYHSAIIKKEILPFSTTWLNLESIILGEIRERPILLHCIWNQICGCQRWEGGMEANWVKFI